jgi:hypothetical protein
MCWSCFKQYTDEPVVNDRVVAAYKLIAAQGEEAHFSPVLHAIVADMNVDDWLFDLSGRDEDSVDRTLDYHTATEWERSIFDALAALTEEERATAVAMEWGYVDERGVKRADLA